MRLGIVFYTSKTPQQALCSVPKSRTVKACMAAPSRRQPLLLVLMLALPALMSALLDVREKEALVALYNTTGGESWVSTAAPWQLTADPCSASWHGVVCSTDTPQHVVELSLSSMSLTGSLPAAISLFSALEYVFAGDLFNL